MNGRMFTWRVLLSILTAGFISITSMSCGGKVEQKEAEQVQEEHPAADETKTEHQHEHPAADETEAEHPAEHPEGDKTEAEHPEHPE